MQNTTSNSPNLGHLKYPAQPIVKTFTVRGGLMVFFRSRYPVKGSVRPNEIGVESRLNRQVLVQDRGAGHYLASLLGCSLFICAFPFPPQYMSTIRRSLQNQEERTEWFCALLFCQLFLFRAPLLGVYSTYRLNSFQPINILSVIGASARGFCALLW